MYCLRDWLLAEKNELLDDKKLLILVFKALEVGLLGELAKDAVKKRRESLEKEKAHKKSRRNFGEN
jgi:hypothetical protein